MLCVLQPGLLGDLSWVLSTVVGQNPTLRALHAPSLIVPCYIHINPFTLIAVTKIICTAVLRFVHSCLHADRCQLTLFQCSMRSNNTNHGGYHCHCLPANSADSMS